MQKKARNDYANSEELSKALLKGCSKEVLDKGDDKYLNFDLASAVQTTDVIGKHIYEFKRREGDQVPELFTLIVLYFEAFPGTLRAEGLFRVAASVDKLDELTIHLQMGNYYIMS